MVEEWLISQFCRSECVILDGFPRTVTQAQALNNLLKLTHFESVKFKIVKMNV